jgi:hypothetical protein
MNIILKNNLVAILFVVFKSQLIGQVNAAFVNHLKMHGLVKEYDLYIKAVKTTEDSINLLRLDYFIAVNKPDSVYNLQKRRISELTKDTILRCELSKYWLRHDEHRHFTDWFDSVLVSPICNCEREILKVFKRGQLKSKIDSAKMDFYMDSYQPLVKSNAKKPLKAALLSTIVPGLGRWYIGRPKLFLINFLAITGYGIQTAEAIRKVGIKNPYSIFMMSFGGMFYLSNIYGTYNETKMIRKEKRHIYFHEAQVFYSDYFSFN